MSAQKRGRKKNATGWSDSAIESLIEAVIASAVHRHPPSGVQSSLVESILHFKLNNLRLLVLGGGTGMSNILGGDADSRGVRGRIVGLKSAFAHLTAVACVTDDGGSTGELLKYLPIIGIGDLRKACTALIEPHRLESRYRLAAHDAFALHRGLQRILAYRFKRQDDPLAILADPTVLCNTRHAVTVPLEVRRQIQKWGRLFTNLAKRKDIPLDNHCLGNLLIVGALIAAGWEDPDKTPSDRLWRIALRIIELTLGIRPDSLFPVTTVPGQLTFRYADGVEVIGQSKAGRSRRGFAVDCVYARYAAHPRVLPEVVRAARQADVIVYAPGSLYSSMIPILQLSDVPRAIRANRRALKILVANFWIQEGETDISPQHGNRGFFVSDTLSAYERNVPGGTEGLFDVVLCSNLEHLPGNILRAYALEGKYPIHLNRDQVSAMGYRPLEATLFSAHPHREDAVVHHDAEKLALAVQTLTFLHRHFPTSVKRLKGKAAVFRPAKRVYAAAAVLPRSDGFLPCVHWQKIKRTLQRIQFSHRAVYDAVKELTWEHRDIQPAHFQWVERVEVVPASKWGRSYDWDNVLGYYEPQRQTIYLHERLLRSRERLHGDLLVALGEAVLGDYIQSRGWEEIGGYGRTYVIRLKPPSSRRSYLSDEELREYLRLVRMNLDPADPLQYRLVLNDGEGFLPPGLHFGLLYAWYLDNRLAPILECEMALLHRPAASLIPYQAMERQRREKLVEFFRTVVFGRRK